MFAQNMTSQDLRTLVRLQQALEVILAHDDLAKVSDIVGLIHIITSDDALTVRKLGEGMLGRGHSAGQRVFKRLQKDYYQNGRMYQGLNFVQPVGGRGHFKLTSKGETVVRSLLALLAPKEDRHGNT